jgi:adapter protein MecA 1/2
MYNGANSLYKCEENNLYYLVINKGNGSVEDFNKVCNILTEYGSMVRSTSANEAYFKEHFKKIIAKKAIQKLAMADINQ